MECVRYEVSDGVARLTLNQPATMNALTVPLLRDCLQAVELAEADRSVRCLLLTGSGKGFCAGADLKEMQAVLEGGSAAASAHVNALLADGGIPFVLALRSLHVPVLCAVNGAAVGGGVGMALAADVVIACESAYFSLPFVPRLGIVPDMGA